MENNASPVSKALMDAYLELLMTMRPERRRTVSGQRILAQMVDAIAETTGNEPEIVQTFFENRVIAINNEPRLTLA